MSTPLYSNLSLHSAVTFFHSSYLPSGMIYHASCLSPLQYGADFSCAWSAQGHSGRVTPWWKGGRSRGNGPGLCCATNVVKILLLEDKMSNIVQTKSLYARTFTIYIIVCVASYPGLPSQLFSQLWKKMPSLFSTAMSEGRPIVCVFSL